jgi:integrase
MQRDLIAWRLRSLHARPGDWVVCTAHANPVQERNPRRALDKANAGLDATAERLSWHSLWHAFASALATDLEVPSTTLARIVGHADAGFTLRLYAKDARDDAVFAAEVLKRAARAGVGR